MLQGKSVVCRMLVAAAVLISVAKLEYVNTVMLTL